jgi:hypothetical protein
LVGPQVLPHRLTGNHYRDFLWHDLLKIPEDVPGAVRARMWYMHDCVSAHFSRAVRDVLSNTYHDGWSPGSSHFNPLLVLLLVLLFI